MKTSIYLFFIFTNRSKNAKTYIFIHVRSFQRRSPITNDLFLIKENILNLKLTAENSRIHT